MVEFRPLADDIFLSCKMVVEFFFDAIVIILVGAIIKGKACKDIFGPSTLSVRQPRSQGLSRTEEKETSWERG